MKMPVHSGMRAKVLTRGYPPCQLFLKPTVHRAVAQGFPLQFLPVSIIALWANCGGHCLGCLAAEVHITQGSPAQTARSVSIPKLPMAQGCARPPSMG